MEDEIFRKVSFYRLILRNGGNDIDPIEVFSHINSLPFTEEGRYLSVSNGNLHSMHVFNNSLPLKITIGTTRRKDLPLLEEGGVSSPLEISGDAGLYEPTHVTIFSDNVVGVESNHYGPKATSITRYINEKAPTIVNEVELIPLMRSDFLEYISRIDLKVHRNMTQTFEEMNQSVYHALEGLKETTNAEYIGITLNSSSQRDIRIGWKERFLNMFQREEVRDSAYKALIKAKDNRTERINEFNLLEPYLISTKKNDSVHRNVNSESMFNAISESYTELRGEIEGIVEIPPNSQQRLDEYLR